jgi:hypothetical protein
MLHRRLTRTGEARAVHWLSSSLAVIPRRCHTGCTWPVSEPAVDSFRLFCILYELNQNLNIDMISCGNVKWLIRTDGELQISAEGGSILWRTS